MALDFGRLGFVVKESLGDLLSIDKKRWFGAVVIASLAAEPLLHLQPVVRTLFSTGALLAAAGVLWKPLMEARRARLELAQRDAEEVARIREDASSALPEGDRG